MLKRISAVLLSIVLAISAMSFTAFAEKRLTAFPGAEGGGMYSQGARAASNFTVYHVTNLNDSGAGSFRDAVSQDNRIIVFDVAGNIMLESSLQIRRSNLTILGQTAPGEGICIGGNDVRFSNANNIIMRYMRFRMGDISDSQEDGLGVRNCTEVILDHCSVSWSIDECLSAYENKNFTAQYCIISESLNQSHHAKGDHGYGGIWGGTNASFHHNLIATHSSRTPRIGSNETVHSYQDRPDYESLIDVRNNVIYNWGNQCAYGGELNTRVNFVNNYYKPTKIANVKYIYDTYGGHDGSGSTIFVKGNVIEGDDGITNDNWTGVIAHDGYTEYTRCNSISEGYTDATGKLWANDQYIYDYPVTTTDAYTAYNNVLDKAGASYFRDSVDTRVINDVRNGTMPVGSKSGEGLIDSQEDVGGWPELKGTKTDDEDNDGMADSWEKENSLDTTKDDSAVIALNGYTNIENYANSLTADSFTSFADKSKLYAEIERAKELNEKDYTEADWAILQEALAEAEEVYRDLSAAQDVTDQVCNRLKEVLDSIVPDYTYYIKEAIEKARAMDLNKYTTESRNAVLQAIETAEADLAAENKDNYAADIQAIEEAIANLKAGDKIKLAKLMDFVRNMDKSSLTYNSRKSIEQQLDKVNAIYYDADASDEEIHNAEQLVYDIVSKGRYKRVNEGKILMLLDFENGYNNELRHESDSQNLSSAKINIVDGYGTNTSKVATTLGDYKFYGRSYFDSCTPALRHYRISYDLLGEDISRNIMELYSGRIPMYTFIKYSDDLWMVQNGRKETTRLDKDYNGFIDTGIWSNFAIEVNMDKNEVIFYVNDLPILKMNEEIEPLDSFRIRFGYDVYIDNIMLTDLSGALYTGVGDADLDGDADASDAALLMDRAAAGRKTPAELNMGEEAMKYIDMDCNGVINSADVAQLLQKILDSSYKTPADIPFEETTEYNTEMTTNGSTEITTEEASTEETTSSIVSYPVEGGGIIFDKSRGYITDDSGYPVNIVIPDSIEGISVYRIDDSAFSNNNKLVSAVIPACVKEIGAYSFARTSLRSLELAYGTEAIERYAFTSTMLEELNIPGSVLSIGNGAFSQCPMLRNVVIEEGTLDIGDNVFMNCQALESVTIPDTVTHIGKFGNSSTTIYCRENSYAQQYAIDNNLKYEIIQ